eukprot:scaffold176741_cov15-Tisochrysis_lutea.AAC.1
MWQQHRYWTSLRISGGVSVCACMRACTSTLIRLGVARGILSDRDGVYFPFQGGPRHMMPNGAQRLTAAALILQQNNDVGRVAWPPTFVCVCVCMFACSQEYRGACRLTELNQRLTAAVMIRRQKDDVASQLPDKIRQK